MYIYVYVHSHCFHRSHENNSQISLIFRGEFFVLLLNAPFLCFEFIVDNSLHVFFGHSAAQNLQN